MNIPLLIPSFNQLTYLRNLINWFRFFYENDIWILDNASSYPPLSEYLSYIDGKDNIQVIRFSYNEGRINLKNIIDKQISKKYEYYIISDPDIMPYPSVPTNFLDIFKYCIDVLGYHHVGFCLKIDDLPEYIDNKDIIMKNESSFWEESITVSFKGQNYKGYKAAIDTTFALYKSNQGWETPMRSEWWNNALRMFQAFHLAWYIDPCNVNKEMDFYFNTAKGPRVGKPMGVINTYRPSVYHYLLYKDQIILFLQTKGFFDDLPDEIIDALAGESFEDEFLNYFFQEKRILLGDLLKEMKGSKLINEINDDLRREFTESIIDFYDSYQQK